MIQLKNSSTLVVLIILCMPYFSCIHKTPPPANKINIDSSDLVQIEDTYPFAFHKQSADWISAHRGGGDMAGYPENCLESIQMLSKQVHTWMEIDIRETADGVLLLMHDEQVDRTTNGTGRVIDLNADDIQSLLLKDNFGQLTTFHPPTLEQVLRWNESERSTVFFLDIKQGVDYRDVIEVVRRTNQTPYVIAIVYNFDQAEAFRRLDHDIVISAPIRGMDEWMRFKDTGLDKDLMMAFTGTRRSDPRLIDTLHAHGMMTILGTMGNIDQQAAARGKRIYQEIYESGIDVISTDRPLDVH